MKVKLLKKIRKRFSIMHYPNGYVGYSGTHYDFNLFKLVDNNASEYANEDWRQYQRNNNVFTQYCDLKHIFYTEIECINSLKSIIINRLRTEGHRGRKDNVVNKKVNKVWHL